MVKVTFQPWEEIIIHESIQHTLEEMIHMQCVGMPAGGLARSLNWAEGVVFRHVNMPPTEDMVRENLQGKVHWSAVSWALMPEYQKIIVIKETKVRLPINDVSANEILSEVARALKKTAEEK